MKKIILGIICFNLFLANTLPVYSAGNVKSFDKTSDIFIPQEIVKERIKDSLVLIVGTNIASVKGLKRLIDKENWNVMPVNKNGRVLVPIRLIIESFGGTALWDDNEKIATITIGEKVIKMKVGERSVNVNGVNKEIDAETVIENGRIFVPLRAVSELLSKNVFWFEWGLILISDSNTKGLDEKNDRYLINEIIRYVLIDKFNPIELENIWVDGKPIENFEGKSKIYSLGIPFTSNIPKIEAKSNKYRVAVVNAQSNPGIAEIKVIDDETGFSTSYMVQFFIDKLKLEQKKEPVFDVPRGLVEIEPIKVTASAVPQPENTPENTLDKNIATRWAAEGEQWIQYDLAEERDIGAIAIAFANGDKRVAWFEVLVSNDGENWQKVLKEESCGVSNEQEVFSFDIKKAKSIRINAYGSSQSRWNSITEVTIYGR